MADPMLPPPGLPPRPPMMPMGNTAPAAMPTSNLGQRAQGIAIVSAVCKVLERAVPMLHVDTDEGRDVLDALKKLSRIAGEVAPDVTENEMKLMTASAPAVAGPGTVPGVQDRLAVRARGGAMAAA
jgi:hypothetical protein